MRGPEHVPASLVGCRGKFWWSRVRDGRMPMRAWWSGGSARRTTRLPGVWGSGPIAPGFPDGHPTPHGEAGMLRVRWEAVRRARRVAIRLPSGLPYAPLGRPERSPVRGPVFPSGGSTEVGSPLRDRLRDPSHAFLRRGDSGRRRARLIGGLVDEPILPWRYWKS